MFSTLSLSALKAKSKYFEWLDENKLKSPKKVLKSNLNYDSAI